MRYTDRPLMALVLGVLLAGCAAATFTLGDEPAELVRTHDGCDPLDEDPPCSYIAFKWPVVIGDSEAADAVRAFIDEQLRVAFGEEQADSKEELADGFLAEFAAFRAEFPGNEIPWVVERQVAPVWDQESLLSLAFEEYAYLGGAHPNTVTSYFVLDRATGGQLQLADLLVDDYANRLTAIAEGIFRAHYGLAADADLEAEGFWFDDGVFRLNDNWLVDPEALRFYFNPYEIAAYVLGPTEIVIPRSDIAELLDPDGPWR